MPRKATGNVYQSRGRWYARITLRPGTRANIALPTCTTEAEAHARLAILADLTAKLRGVEHVSSQVLRGLLERAGAREGKALDDVLRAADMVASGQAAPRSAPWMTIRDLGRRWTTGELAREYPDHVRQKRSAHTDASWLENYINPAVGDVPVADFTLDHAEAVMRSVSAERASATRRAIAQTLHRLLSMAVFPLRLIPSNPLPRGFLPKIGPGKAKGWVYPDEDARLLASPDVPLCWRVFYGFLHREGLRTSEATALTWSDLDLERGAITLDENKTDDPRAWALSPGCTAALRAWRDGRRQHEAILTERSAVFVNEEAQPIIVRHLAEQYREHLQAAGITRPALFERSASRQRIRLHDTRATFITIALATGRSEAWVQDRTGHRSSIMINRYRRAARTAAELGLGELAPLDRAIPELAAAAASPFPPAPPATPALPAPSTPPALPPPAAAAAASTEAAFPPDGGPDRGPHGGPGKGGRKGGGKGGRQTSPPHDRTPTAPRNPQQFQPSSPARTRTGTPFRAVDFKYRMPCRSGFNSASVHGGQRG